MSSGGNRFRRCNQRVSPGYRRGLRKRAVSEVYVVLLALSVPFLMILFLLAMEWEEARLVRAVHTQAPERDPSESGTVTSGQIGGL
jgi:hypothetical protein